MSTQIHPDGVAVFDHLTAELPGLLDRLLAEPAAPASGHEEIPESAAIYLFSELDRPI
jgi:hypothetical protein